jgi:ribonuclease BN (tRNA processing enzyme)
MAAGADVLVHEACRTSAMRDLIAGTLFETIFDCHADTVALGGLAEAAGVGHLVLTHRSRHRPTPPPSRPSPTTSGTVATRARSPWVVTSSPSRSADRRDDRRPSHLNQKEFP